jgi:hypothetical protein
VYIELNTNGDLTLKNITQTVESETQTALFFGGDFVVNTD